MKRIISLVLVTTMILTSLAGCSGSGQSGTDKQTAAAEGTESKAAKGETQAASGNVKRDFILAKEADATTLDPQAGWDGNSLTVLICSKIP